MTQKTRRDSPSLTPRLVASFALVASGVVLSSSLAFAEGSEHHGSIMDLKWFWLNFVIYSVLLTIILKKPIRNGWIGRRQRIMNSVSSASDELASAERELSSIEALLKNSAIEQQRVHSEIVRQGELEAEEISKAAAERSARIASQVKDLLEGESRSAQIAFRAALVKRAVEISKGRFESGEFASRQTTYVDAAISRAKRLM